MSCKHRKSWIICGGRYEWCYQCGALRRCVEIGPAEIAAATKWSRPTGIDGNNPWPMKDIIKNG